VLVNLLKKLGYLKLLENRGFIENENNPKLTKKALEYIGETDLWVEDWIKLWPTGLDKKIGYSVSGNSESCKLRMNKFIVKYEYDKDTIFKATELYLKSQEINNWHYTKKNYKFIYDKESSTLEDYCKRILEGDNTEAIDNRFDFL